MQKRNAFTLIELLVVIAIIAILAAILFPVFAQARVAAKGTASLSNAKQTMLGIIMYSNDADDTFVPVGYPDPTAPIGWAPNFIRTWAQSITPYIKTADILLDPLTSPDDYSWGPRNAVIGYYPQYGYAFEVVSPIKGLGQPRPLSQSGLGSPSETVVMAAKATPWLEYNPGWDERSLDASFTIGAPFCDASSGWTTGVNPQSWCNYVSPGWRNSWGFQAEGATVPFQAGGYTGLVSMRRADKATVGFGDGHVQVLSDGALAKGTNYARTQAPSALTITNKSEYMWDAD